MQNLKEKILGKIKPLVEKVTSGNSSRGYGDYDASKVGEENEVVLENWNSDEGKRRLFRSDYNQAFFRLAHVYQPQLNPFYAGVACSVATLNALRVDKGTIPNQDGFDYIDKDGKEYHYTLYSQLTLLNEKTERVKKKSDIAPSILEEEIRATKEFNPGLNLYQVMHILEVYDADVEIHYAEEEAEKNIEEFSADLKEALNNPDKVFIANFDGNLIGLDSGGHFSVIGAYDEISESVLVLDTAAHKNPWYWAPIHHLYHAMHTKHGDQYRGYLIVSDKK
jgi:hypothetical protein